MEENYQQILIDDETNNHNNINSYTLSHLNEDEILKAKENGFILIGKTGTGKTSLLNIMFGDDVGKVGYSTQSETKNTNYYYIKENIGNKSIYFCLVDTPGLYDSDGEEADKNQKIEIIKLISKKKIKVKGLLFLSNFQNERFDGSEQMSLIEYNSLFPLKDFWNHLIIIFTHYYGDPDGDSKEEIKEKSHKILSQLFITIMNKVKDISDPVNFENLNRQYINIFSRPKNEIQIKNNKEVRNQLMLEIEKYIDLSPMFNKIQVLHLRQYEPKLNSKSIYDCDITLYLDINENIINKNINILKTNSNNNKKESLMYIDSEECIMDQEGNLVKKGSGNESFINKYKIAPSMAVISILGGIVSFYVFWPALSICAIGLILSYFINKSSENRNNNETEIIKKIIEKQNINEEILKKIEDD